MMFVFYPIDVVLLNAKKEVVEFRKSFKPFTLFFSENKAKYVLELEDTSLEKKGVRIGDKITF